MGPAAQAATTPSSSSGGDAVTTRRLALAVDCILAAVTLAGCGTTASPAKPTLSAWQTTPDWAKITTLPRTPEPAPTIDTLATAARQQIDENYSATTWYPFMADVTEAHGVLRITLQVDRHDADASELADRAAIAVRNLVATSDALKSITWVEILDGTGAHITQESAR